jgi:hypothetical protein
MCHDNPSANNIKKYHGQNVYILELGIIIIIIIINKKKEKKKKKERKKITILPIWAIIPGKNGEKNDCLNGFNQQIHPKPGKHSKLERQLLLYH